MTKLYKIISGITNVIGAVILVIAIIDVALTLGMNHFGIILIAVLIGTSMITFKIE